MRTFHFTAAILSLGTVALSFQNCTRAQFDFIASSDKTIAQSCGDESCDLTPLTTKPTVTTILLALGDSVNNQLVGNPVSNRFIVESVVRLSSPLLHPKILVVHARETAGESDEDTPYIYSLLAAHFSATLIEEPEAGLTPDQLGGYDLVWFNNPGYPMSSIQSRDTLINFAGAVVLQGDDLSYGLTPQGVSFSMTALTGLQFIDNGTDITCDGISYHTDNNAGEQYLVSLNPSKIRGVDASTVSFRYGNDIDNTVVASADVEVLATAIGAPPGCTETRPAIVRRFK